MDPLVSYTTGRGYIPYTINITNTVNTSQSVNVGYFYTYWDFNPPVIDDFTYTSDARKLFLYVTDNDRTDNWQLSAWDTRDFTVKATNSANQVFTMPLITSRDESYKNKYAEFNTASLAEGCTTSRRPRLTPTATPRQERSPGWWLTRLARVSA